MRLHYYFYPRLTLKETLSSWCDIILEKLSAAIFVFAALTLRESVHISAVASLEPASLFLTSGNFQGHHISSFEVSCTCLFLSLSV